MSKGRKIRYICGVLLIIGGIGNLFRDFLVAIMSLICGVMLLPYIYDHTALGRLKKSDIARYVIGMFFIFSGLQEMGNEFIDALGMILIGISIFPILYSKTKLGSIKYSSIVIPIAVTVLSLLFAVLLS